MKPNPSTTPMPKIVQPPKLDYGRGSEAAGAISDARIRLERLQ